MTLVRCIPIPETQLYEKSDIRIPNSQPVYFIFTETGRVSCELAHNSQQWPHLKSDFNHRMHVSLEKK